MDLARKIALLLLVLALSCHLTCGLFWLKFKRCYFGITPFPIITLAPTARVNGSILFPNTTPLPGVTLIDPRFQTSFNSGVSVRQQQLRDAELSVEILTPIEVRAPERQTQCSSIQPPCPERGGFTKPGRSTDTTGVLPNGCPCTDMDRVVELLRSARN